jgi:ferrous iron transport protein A
MPASNRKQLGVCCPGAGCLMSFRTTPFAPFPLAMAQEGERLRIHLLRGGKGLEMRLTALGLNVGSELTVSQRSGDSLVVLRGDARIALGAGMAHKIMVVRPHPE